MSRRLESRAIPLQSHITRLEHGVSLFDEWFPAGFAKGRHTHDDGYFCLMVAGGFRERYGHRDRTAQVGSVVRYAPREPKGCLRSQRKWRRRCKFIATRLHVNSVS